jgi:hypothetical protein
MVTGITCRAGKVSLREGAAGTMLVAWQATVLAT